MEEPNMEIVTNAGIAKPMPLSDAQRYNDFIRILKWFITVFGIPWVLWTVIGMYLLYKIFSTGVINLIISKI